MIVTKNLKFKPWTLQQQKLYSMFYHYIQPQIKEADKDNFVGGKKCKLMRMIKNNSKCADSS